MACPQLPNLWWASSVPRCHRALRRSISVKCAISDSHDQVLFKHTFTATPARNRLHAKWKAVAVTFRLFQIFVAIKRFIRTRTTSAKCTARRSEPCKHLDLQHLHVDEDIIDTTFHHGWFTKTLPSFHYSPFVNQFEMNLVGYYRHFADLNSVSPWAILHLDRRYFFVCSNPKDWILLLFSCLTYRRSLRYPLVFFIYLTRWMYSVWFLLHKRRLWHFTGCKLRGIIMTKSKHRDETLRRGIVLDEHVHFQSPCITIMMKFRNDCWQSNLLVKVANEGYPFASCLPFQWVGLGFVMERPCHWTRMNMQSCTISEEIGSDQRLC